MSGNAKKRQPDLPFLHVKINVGQVRFVEPLPDKQHLQNDEQTIAALAGELHSHYDNYINAAIKIFSRNVWVTCE